MPELAPAPPSIDASSSLDRALDLLFHLHAAGEPQGVTQAARATGVPKSSAHRMLAALARRGLVERDGRGRYVVGYALVALGLGAQGREGIVRLARPVLESTARALSETVFLCGARGSRVVVLDKAEGTGFLRAAPEVGSRIPAHATAVGRLFLAHGAEGVDPGPEPWETFSPTTPRTRAVLEPELARIRQQGFAENRGGWIAGLWVLAAPVFFRGELVASVAAAAPETRRQSLVPGIAEAQVGAAARRIERRLEGRDEEVPA